MRARGYGFLLALLSAAGQAAAAADPWPTTEFELFFGEPWYYGNPNATTVGRAIDDNLFSLDTEVGRPKWVPETTVRQIERYLHEVAEQLQADGFRSPALEPMVRRADGKLAYRIYFFDTNLGAPAAYKNGCFGGAVRRLIEVDLEATAGAGFAIDKNGRFTDKGHQDLAHELFHAVQAAYPPFREVCDLGDWIVEGTADAIGFDMARRLRSIEPSSPPSLGLRRYHLPLRTVDDPACPSETAADGLGCKPKNDGYWTSSFWRYLGEMNASGGSYPALTFVEPDYAYLHRFFSQALSGAAAEDTELAWLDGNLSSARGFSKGLNRVYATFVTAFSTYPWNRLARNGKPAPNAQQWLEIAFDQCPELTISPDQPPVSLTLELQTVAAACVQLVAGIGGPFFIQITAHPEGSGVGLQDLWVGTQAGVAVGRPLLVRVKETGFAEWRFRIEFAPEDVNTIVISNVANDPASSSVQTLELRVTASYWDSSVTP